MHLDNYVRFVEAKQYDNAAFDGEGAAEFIKQCIEHLLDLVKDRAINSGQNFARFEQLTHSIYQGSKQTIITVVGIYNHIC